MENKWIKNNLSRIVCVLVMQNCNIQICQVPVSDSHTWDKCQQHSCVDASAGERTLELPRL